MRQYQPLTEIDEQGGGTNVDEEEEAKDDDLADAEEFADQQELLNTIEGIYASYGMMDPGHSSEVAIMEAREKLTEMQNDIDQLPKEGQLDPMFDLQREAMRRFDEAEKANKLMKLELKKKEFEALEDDLTQKMLENEIERQTQMQMTEIEENLFLIARLFKMAGSVEEGWKALDDLEMFRKKH